MCSQTPAAEERLADSTLHDATAQQQRFTGSSIGVGMHQKPPQHLTDACTSPLLVGHLTFSTCPFSLQVSQVQVDSTIYKASRPCAPDGDGGTNCGIPVGYKGIPGRTGTVYLPKVSRRWAGSPRVSDGVVLQ